MAEAGQYLVGEHDFSAFRAAECQARTASRLLTRLEVRREGAIIRVDVSANAFLHHMVRNIVGTLAVVGRGEADPAWVGDVLAGRDRRRAGMTAPAAGLFLVRVDYGDMLPQPEAEPPRGPPGDAGPG
jgi:tRNA pseudouridine38-40 synthase